MTDACPPAGVTAARVAARPRWLAVAGAVTMFLVQPPADVWLLAWLAPLPWLGLVRHAGPLPWGTLWGAGFLHWLLTIHWLRLPHPATAIGWVLLAAYLGGTLPLFVAAGRWMTWCWRWPLVVAAPVAWIGVEQARGWFLGGFTLGALGHTQWRVLPLLQVADLFGACGVGGVVMTVAAALAMLVSKVGAGRGVTATAPEAATPSRDRLLPTLAVAGSVLGMALAYGGWRLAGAPSPTAPLLDVLLVQGSIDTELKHDPAAAGDVLEHYDTLTRQGLAAGARLPDLVVWPETMWRYGLLEIDPAERLPEAVVERVLGGAAPEPSAALDAERQRACRAALEEERRAALAAYARRYGTAWLVGVDRQEITPAAAAGSRHYNTALCLDATGRVLARYDKMFPVMFGEYIPGADRFPWLYRLSPLPAGLTAGREPVAIDLAGARIAPTICYETTLPEALRSLVRRLAAAGQRPDVIVNLTNDGWFWGSSELDMHLRSAVFRAVEVRTPVVVAANTGFSAWIDGNGRLLARGPRRATATVRAAVTADGRWSPWLTWGSLPTGVCVVVVAITMVGQFRRCLRRPGSATRGAETTATGPLQTR
ncbi:MAG: apolipoprotein N-acyltransferase [Planctomycetia bacterium]|nr:apolipoprotein N-acyltransferase [Planctomycetia bacterium]